VTVLPSQDDGSVLLRTEYSDESAWQSALRAATTPHPQPDGWVFEAHLTPYEDKALAGKPPEVIASLPSGGYLSFAFIADGRTMADHTFVVLDLAEERGRWFRCTAEAVQAIENNLSLANMDFYEFADAADPDGVFRDLA